MAKGDSDVNLVHELIRKDRESPLRLAVVGDAIDDTYIDGTLGIGQENCQKFTETSRISVSGGAENAAKSLVHWNTKAISFATDAESKTRFMVDGRCIFRHDAPRRYDSFAKIDRYNAKSALHSDYSGVLISDYDKGFLTPEFIREIIDLCNERKIPCVADAKREPDLYEGSTIKGNADYHDKFNVLAPYCVLTHGPNYPDVWTPERWSREDDEGLDKPPRPSVLCKNHVGAGDCFSSHLLLALAHGFTLEQAAEIAHCAGRVYVQHEHNRPPWPHEIARDYDPVGGKILDVHVLPALRKSESGRIVFANGCFDLFGPQHLHYLTKAKELGDGLVVGINTDESVSRLKGKARPLIPQKQRAILLAGIACVDWVVLFDADDPASIMSDLKPNVRACTESPNRNIAGDEFADELAFIDRMEGWSTTSTLESIVKKQTR